MRDPYQVLGIPRTATDDEVKNAYRALARKYHPDNYSADNPLADLATEKMKEINEAYEQIQRERSHSSRNQSAGNGYTGSAGGSNSAYYEIRTLLNQKRYGQAEAKLSAIPEVDRDAEWHYLESIVLAGRGYFNDAMRELELACSMDPYNEEYQRAKEMFNRRAGSFGSIYYGDGNRRRYNSSDDTLCNTCFGLWACDTCCECMGADLCSCC